jgi:hypothetical protein
VRRGTAAVRPVRPRVTCINKRFKDTDESRNDAPCGSLTFDLLNERFWNDDGCGSSRLSKTRRASLVGPSRAIGQRQCQDFAFERKRERQRERGGPIRLRRVPST